MIQFLTDCVYRMVEEMSAMQLHAFPAARAQALAGVWLRHFTHDMGRNASRTQAEPTLADLVATIASNNDRAAFRELFVHFAPRIKAYFKHLGVADQTAEDMMQEVMITVWRRAGLYDAAQASVGTWIFTIARNKRIDDFRRERRPQIDLEDPMLVRASDPAADEAWSRREAERRLRRAVAALPEEQALVLRKNFFEDKSHGAIAKELKLPLGTVKSRARLALARLRQALRDLD